MGWWARGWGEKEGRDKEASTYRHALLQCHGYVFVLVSVVVVCVEEVLVWLSLRTTKKALCYFEEECGERSEGWVGCDGWDEI